MESLTVSDAEWEVLRILWSLGEATSNEVSTLLKSSHDWETTTTKTLLARLVKKGYVRTTSKGRAFIYHPTITESEGTVDRVDQTLNQVCSKKVGSILLHIIENFDLTHQDKASLMNALDSKQTTDTVPCNCMERCVCNPASKG